MAEGIIGEWMWEIFFVGAGGCELMWVEVDEALVVGGEDFDVFHPILRRRRRVGV
jgi:hypothetical protein